MNPRSARGMAQRIAVLALVGLGLGWVGWRVSMNAGLVTAILLAALILLALFVRSRMRSQGDSPLRQLSDWGERHSALYRLIASCPECARFPDDDSRQDAIQKLNYGTLRKWWFPLVAVLVCLVILLSARWAGRVLFAAVPYIPLPAWWFALALVEVAVFWAALWAGIRHRIRKHLRQRLVDCGVPICVHCGYDLRGQTVPRCPECGRPFDPALLSLQALKKGPGDRPSR